METGDRELRRRDRRPKGLKPFKQLFTRTIKQQLKAWLLKRRHYPYPSRREKCQLAIQLGLTYVQISNWFANWRRKFKMHGTSDTCAKLARKFTVENGQSQENTSTPQIWPSMPPDEHVIPKEETFGELKNYPWNWECFSKELPTTQELGKGHEGGVTQDHMAITGDLSDKKTETLRKWLTSAASFTPDPETHMGRFQCYCCPHKHSNLSLGNDYWPWAGNSKPSNPPHTTCHVGLVDEAVKKCYEDYSKVQQRAHDFSRHRTSEFCPPRMNEGWGEDLSLYEAELEAAQALTTMANRAKTM